MLVLIKGAGDLATGTAVRLYRAGFQIVMTDIAQPTAVRRTVAFCQCMYDGVTEVEGITARRAADKDEAQAILAAGEIPVLCDPEAGILKELHFDAVVDAILAKRNLGTSLTDAPIVLALGPGFTAGVDCHGVIETKRGHDLGRLILEGSAIPNTGVVRGMLPAGIPVTEGMKAGDIDPRCEVRHCFTVSDKARAIGGGVLEGLLYFGRRSGLWND